MSHSSDPVVQAITQARVTMLLDYPFFGNLALHLRLVDATKWCETVASDGKHLYYNREFIKGLTTDELIYVIGHEIMHAVFDHLGRQGDRDKHIWDMAIDYIANYTLKKEEIGDAPLGALYNDRYTDEMTSEEVYEDLKKNSVTIEMPLDMHIDVDDSSSSDGDGQSVSVTIFGDENGPPKLTQEDMEKIKRELMNNMMNAAQAAGAGNVPASIARLIDSFVSPIMDWRSLLEMHIQSSIKDDYTFMRPSRRSWDAGVILPGQEFATTANAFCAIDTSGSMSEEMIRDMLSEVKGIMETFDDFELWVCTFDTRVYNPQRFTLENIDDILTYQPGGGGGTDFSCVWEFLKDPSSVDPLIEEDEIVPSKLIMFTDGYDFGDNGLKYADYTDTLFIIHGRTGGYEPGHGTVAYYQNN